MWRLSYSERFFRITFVVALLILVLVGGLSLQTRIRASEDQARVEHTYQVILNIENIFSLLKDAETGQRGYLITGVPSYLDPYHNALNSIPADLDTLHGLIVDNPAQQQNLTDLETLIAQKREELQKTIALRDSDGFEAAAQLVQTNDGEQVMDAIRQLVAKMEDEERTLLQQRQQASQMSTQAADLFSLLALLLGSGLLVTSFVALNRELVQRQQAEAEVRGINKTLELRVGERTHELVVTNESLSTEVIKRQQAQAATEQYAIKQAFLAEASATLSASLDYETTLAVVARLAVPSIGDWCAVDMQQTDRTIKRLAVAHVDPEKVIWAYELAKRYPIDLNAPTGLPYVLRTGTPEFYPDISHELMVTAIKDPEQLELARQIGFSSSIVVPLIIRAEVLGALTLVYTESKRHYTHEDLEFAQELATRAAIAIDNARLYAEAQAQREQWRVTLFSIGDAVIATNSKGCITFVNPVAQTLTGWSQAEAHGKPLDTVFRIINEITRQTVENPATKVMQLGTIIGLANHTILIAKDGQEIPIDDSGAPIRDDTGTITGVILVFRDISERRKAEAIERQYIERQNFLLEASAVLNSSLDYGETLASLTRLAVPRMGDWCAVDMLQSDHTIKRLAVAHIDPEKVDWAYEVHRRFPTSIDAPAGVPHVVRTGQSEYLPDISPEQFKAAIKDPELLDLTLKVGFSSAMIVPLKARETVLGALTLVWAESSNHYTPNDLAVAQILGFRAGVAVENARLYREVQTQREQLSVTLASIGDAVIATNTAGHITFMNGEARALTGWLPIEAVGRPIHEVFNIINEHTRQVVENPIDKAIQSGRVVGLANHTILIAKDGQEIPIDDSGAPIRDDTGTITGVILVFRNITARKQAEEERARLYRAVQVAADRMARLQAVTAALSSVMTISEVVNIFIYQGVEAVGAAAANVALPLDEKTLRIIDATGYSTETIQAWHEFSLDVLTPMTEAIRTQAPHWIESREAWLTDHPSIPIRDTLHQAWAVLPLTIKGRILGGISFGFVQARSFSPEDQALIVALAEQCAQAVDRAQTYEREEHARIEAEKARQAAEHANELKLKFLAMISHELRTPLTSIKGFATTLLATDVVWDDETQHQFITFIDEEADKLTELIDQLLDLSQLQAGTLRIHPIPASFHNVINRARPQLEALAQHHQLTIHLQPELPLVMVDPQRIAEVLTNLVGNAVKYAPERTPIQIKATRQAEMVRVDVSDEGPGILPENREIVFEAFRQLDGKSSQQTKGAGLGLAICKGLVEAHHGHIWIDAGPNVGTTISFTLRVASA